MSRKSSKAKSSKETAQAILDRFLSEVEPMVPVAGILGGTAAVCGVIPPFTRLLDMIGQASQAGNGVKLDLERLGVLVTSPYMGGPLLLFEALLGGGGDGGGAQNSNRTANIGLFCAGALEAMMMYNALKNPEVVTSLIKAPAEVIKGIGEIIPG